MITHFLHAAIIVSNLERSSWFYGTVLGLPVMDRPLNFPGIWYQVGSCQIHLILNTNAKDDRVNLDQWGRNRHLALAVDTLADYQTRLERHGCSIQLSASGRSALFTADPDGNVIELTQINS